MTTMMMMNNNSLQNLSSIPHLSDLCFYNNGVENAEEGCWDENLFTSEKVSFKYFFARFFLKFLYIPTLYFVDHIIVTNFMVTS